MKILWTVNTIFPFPAEKLGIKKNPFGGWLLGLYNKIKDYPNIKLYIVSPYKGRTIKKIIDFDTTYYLVPCSNPNKESKKFERYCKEIYNEVVPDIIHIHGTEYMYGRAFQKISNSCKNIVSIQGIKYVYSNYYLANLQYKEIKRCRTLRNYIKGSIIKGQENFYKSSKLEIDTINNSDAIVGRTTFDYANTVSLSREKKYYKCNESLRDEFYNHAWSLDKIDRHSIYISQGGYPIKGLHIMIEALKILKNNYPDVKLFIAGKDVFKFNGLMDYIKYSDYQKLIAKKIKEYDLVDNIEYMGSLNAEQVRDRLLKSNVYVQAASIENSSNALGEAMLLGVPCVASYVGGTPDMLENKVEGLLYPFGDYGILAHYISKVFENDDLAMKLGSNAKKHAEITHDGDINASKMMEIYNDVINDSKQE